jgi:hypothetical protein
VTVFAGAVITACGASSSRRHPDRNDAGDTDAGTGGKPGAGGASGTGGSSGTGGKASGGTPGTGGVEAGVLDSGVPDASAGGSAPDGGDASANGGDASADANTGVPEAGTACADAGLPGCDWLVQGGDNPDVISGGTFRVLLRPGVNLPQSGVLTLSVADCSGYQTYPETLQVEVNVDVNGRELTAELSTALEQFNDAWIADMHLDVTTVCGETLSIRINNDGTYSAPNNCSDSLGLASCF